MNTRIRPELQIKPGSQSQVLTTVDGKAVWANAQVPDISNITNLESQLGSKADKVDTYTKGQVDQKIADLVGSAPETLDTLQELAAALNDDENALLSLESTLRGEISAKMDQYVEDTEFNAYRTKVLNAFNNLATAAREDINYLHTKVSGSVPVDIKATMSSRVEAGEAAISGRTINRLGLYVDVYLNGLLQEQSMDYNIGLTDIRFTSELQEGDVIVIKYRPTRYTLPSTTNDVVGKVDFSTMLS